ncbi:MAG: DUF342 domain-containing protein [Dehalococcoidia bacterium]|nr:DUF342 domain-containing protein [Dehalococcoidia bacterium]
MDGEPPPSDDHPRDAGFDMAFRGRAVEVTLRPFAPPAAAPSVDAILAALGPIPLGLVAREAIEAALTELPEATTEIRVTAGEILVPPDAVTPCAIVLSANRLAAYAVPVDPPPAPAPPDPATDDLPPEDAAATETPEAIETLGAIEAIEAIAATETPAAIDPNGATEPTGAPGAPEPPEATATTEEPPQALPDTPPEPLTLSTALLRQTIAAAGVVTVLLDDVIDAFGDGAPFEESRCVARGTASIRGPDAVLEYHFDPHPRLIPRPRTNGSVDYYSTLTERFVAAEAPLTTRHPPVPGTPGCTVLGVALVVAPVRDVRIEPLVGKGTDLRGDELIATLPGRPVIAGNGRVDILPVFEVAGNLDYSVGNIDFPGDVVVPGDVRPGFSIVAGGSVAVTGWWRALRSPPRTTSP